MFRHIGSGRDLGRVESLPRLCGAEAPVVVDVRDHDVYVDWAGRAVVHDGRRVVALRVVLNGTVHPSPYPRS